MAFNFHELSQESRIPSGFGNRRMELSNSIVHSDYDIICLCETWLREDVTTASIFLNNYNVYKNDSTTTQTRKSRHKGVLIAVQNQVANDLLTIMCLHMMLEIRLSGKENQITRKNSHLMLHLQCTCPRSYQWNSDEFLNLMQESEDIKSSNKLNQCEIIITGDIYFSPKNWKTVFKTNPYGTQIPENFVELILYQHAKAQLNVRLSSNPELTVSCQVDKLLLKKLSNQFSDHKPQASTLLTSTYCDINNTKNHL